MSSIKIHLRDSLCYLDVMNALEQHLDMYDTIVCVGNDNILICKILKIYNGWEVVYEQDNHIFATRTYTDINKAIKKFIKYNVTNERNTAAIHSYTASILKQTIHTTCNLIYHCNENCGTIVKLLNENKMGMRQLSSLGPWCARCVPNYFLALLKLWAAVE